MITFVFHYWCLVQLIVTGNIEDTNYSSFGRQNIFFFVMKKTEYLLYFQEYFNSCFERKRYLLNTNNKA